MPRDTLKGGLHQLQTVLYAAADIHSATSAGPGTVACTHVQFELQIPIKNIWDVFPLNNGLCRSLSRAVPSSIATGPRILTAGRYR